MISCIETTMIFITQLLEACQSEWVRKSVEMKWNHQPKCYISIPNQWKRYQWKAHICTVMNVLLFSNVTTALPTIHSTLVTRATFTGFIVKRILEQRINLVMILNHRFLFYLLALAESNQCEQWKVLRSTFCRRIDWSRFYRDSSIFTTTLPLNRFKTSSWNFSKAGLFSGLVTIMNPVLVAFACFRRTLISSRGKIVRLSRSASVPKTYEK